MECSYRWGIIGCGRVSHDFVQALKFLPQAKVLSSKCPRLQLQLAAQAQRAEGICGLWCREQVIGVSARHVESARRFAGLHGIDRVYDSYEALCADSGARQTRGR